MCGIFGYLGERNAVEISLKGIAFLEYRGYDSAGVAWIEDGKIFHHKRVGKVAGLKEAMPRIGEGKIAIAHTRWATHGEPSDINAHPQFDCTGKIAVIHNGIIENHQCLRDMLENKGIHFCSQTDTEVIAQLIHYFYQGHLLDALCQMLALVEGSFSLLILHEDHPDRMVCVARESPLIIGQGEREFFVASDPHAFVEHTNKVIYLHTGEIAMIHSEGMVTYNQKALPILKETEELSLASRTISRDGYAHYMLKEIHEQKQTLLHALYGRISWEYGSALFDEIPHAISELLSIERIIIVSCGSSWHAGLVGQYLFGEKARIPVEVEISSELRYKNPIVYHNTLAIAISQSGETADTLAAAKELKRKGARLLGICNVQGSSLTREVQHTIFLKAGPEIGVASTKVFTSQLVVLTLLALQFARMRVMSHSEGEIILSALMELPRQIEKILQQEGRIAEIARTYAAYDNMFFLGRNLMYPTALEGALKLKEITYIHAHGYPAGEMKHGPIALIAPSCPTIAYCCNQKTQQKMMSNLMEIKARKGPICAIAFEGDDHVARLADDVFYIPSTLDELAPITATLFSQLFAYYIAQERKTDIDQPRNLAKSVTVE